MFLSTCFINLFYQLFDQHVINILSTFYQPFINFHQHFINFVYQPFFMNLSSTVYQFYQLFINFSSTFYQLLINLINFLSTFYQLCISCVSTFHQHMTNVLLLYLKISKTFLFIDSLLFCMNFPGDYLIFL